MKYKKKMEGPYSTKITLYGAAHYNIRHNTPIHVWLHVQQKSHYTERPITTFDNTPIHACFTFDKNYIIWRVRK